VIWRILRATATLGGWVLAALALAYLERLVSPSTTGPAARPYPPDEP
jgi:hypothetical protein